MEEVRKLPFVFTYEDHNPDTGIGAIIATWLVDHGFKGRMARFGVTEYGPSGNGGDTQEEHLDIDSMIEAIWNIMR